MKSITILALGIGVLTLVSCRKEAVQPSAETTEQSAAQNQSKTVSVSAWQPIGNWSRNSGEQGGASSGTINDGAISSEVAGEGLILVFMKQGNTTQSLPYLQGDIYWNYQVEAGSIVVNATSASSKGSISQDQPFQYIILTKEKLEELEGQGQSKSGLMDLSYDQAIALLN